MTKYWYRVKATSAADGDSGYGYLAQPLAMPAPSNLRLQAAAGPGASGIDVTWQDNGTPDNAVTGFTIQRATNSTFTANLTSFSVAADTTYYEDTFRQGTSTKGALVVHVHLAAVW